MKREKFRSRKPVVEAKIFGEKANFTANLNTREGAAEDFSIAAGGFYESEQHLDRGAFAGAIGSEESKDFAAPDLQGESTHGDLIAEYFAEAVGIDGQGIGGWQKSSVIQWLCGIPSGVRNFSMVETKRDSSLRGLRSE